MTTDIDAQKLAEIYKAMDERMEIVCAVAHRLVNSLEIDIARHSGAISLCTARLMAELLRVMK
jgi:hypothetical protein